MGDTQFNFRIRQCHSRPHPYHSRKTYDMNSPVTLQVRTKLHANKTTISTFHLGYLFFIRHTVHMIWYGAWRVGGWDVPPTNFQCTPGKVVSRKTRFLSSLSHCMLFRRVLAFFRMRSGWFSRSVLYLQWTSFKCQGRQILYFIWFLHCVLWNGMVYISPRDHLFCDNVFTSNNCVN